MDRKGRCGSQRFAYVAGGVGVGFSISGESDWVEFDTSIKIRIEQFHGPAMHAGFSMSVAGPLGAGSWDAITMYGPRLNAGADPPVAIWPSLSWLGSPGGEVSLTQGMLN